MARHLRGWHPGRQELTVPPGADTASGDPPAGPLAERETRRRLLAALVSVHPWLADPDLGPAAVDAGPCDRCGDLPRIVAPCGPVAWRGLCRDCLVDVGVAAFCSGHVDEAETANARSRELPDAWDTLVRLTWVASGQVAADRAWLELAADRLADPTLAELVAPGPA